MATETTPSGIEFLRTPEERFGDLPDFPHIPHHVYIDGLRMAYIDEGAGEEASTILLLHGEPTWSFLYRRMIPVLVEAGHRVIAPDLIGFGRSDKPVERSAYTYESHIAWLTEFLDDLDAQTLDLFCQDWGGLLGLRIAAANPDRFERMIIANTALPVGRTLGPGFAQWLETSQSIENFDCGAMLEFSTQMRKLTDAEQNAYRAPFPDERYLAGAREFPKLVPITSKHAGVAENKAAWAVLRKWKKPVLTLWGSADPVLGHLADEFRKRIPGAKGQPHQDFEKAGHFIQDDVGAPLAQAVVDWLASLA